MSVADLPEPDLGNCFSASAFLRQRGRRDAARAHVVLVHGLGESGLCFRRIWNAPQLDDVHLLCWDLPGYGKSAWRERPLTIAEHAVFLRERLRATLAERHAPTVLVGHSMGGVIGQFLCELEADDERTVDQLIDVEGNISLSDCTLSATAAAQSLEAWCRSGQENAAHVLYLEGVQEPASRTYYASLELCDPRAFHLNSRELVELSRGEALADRLGALDLPVDYVLGDPGGTGSHSQELLTRADVPLHSVSHSGHWPFIDHPDQFLEVLTGLLPGPTA